LAVSTRTIFLFIRGVDQSGRAFNVLDRRIDNLIRKEMEMGAKSIKVARETVREQNKLLFAMQAIDRAAYRLIFAGAAFTAFAGLMVMGIANIVSASSSGELYMEDFGRAWERLSIAVSEAILEKWGPAIQDFIGWLGDLADNETFLMITSGALIPITIALGVMGVTLLVVGIVSKFATLLFTLLTTVMGIPAGNLAFGVGLALEITIPILLIFTVGAIFGWLKDQFEKWLEEAFGYTEIENLRKDLGFGSIMAPQAEKSASIWDWLEENIFGKKPTGFDWALGGGQTGHATIGRTGPMMVHEGEWLFNPQLPISPPPQMRGMMGGGGPIEIIINQYIDSVATEADETRLAQKTAEYLGDKLTEMIG